MAGHSKWANIKYRKDRADRKKGKVFSRIIKEVISAVRQGGPDPKTNNKLRIAINKAKEANVPSDNIERNIKKASSAGQQDFSELVYELYGFGGVGIIVSGMTDNKNRFASDIRIATNKCGGTIASPGSVIYNFEHKGVIRISIGSIKEDDLFLLVSNAGADDFSLDEGFYVITTPADIFSVVKEAVERTGVRPEEAEIEMVPKVYVEVDEENGQKNAALIEWLENLDDVDAVYHNMK
jgi:YebC/PmpR family DNA-binding regulatory protein